MARYDPDYFAKAVEPALKAVANQLPAEPPANVLALRAAVHPVLEVYYQNPPAPASIVQTRFDIAVPSTGGTVAVYRFATAEQIAAKNQPAVVYLHAGGMVCGTVPLMAANIANQAADAGVQFWAVDYQLSPEASAPIAVEESYAALTYLSTHATELGLDNTRLAVAGASAGGGLTAGVGLLARDREFRPPLAKLIMIYPMLDDRTVQSHPPRGARHVGANTADDDWPLRPMLMWTCEQNALGWAAYLNVGKPGVDGPLEAAAALAQATVTNASPYAIPARASSLAGLPSTYMDVGSLDLFLEEDAHFAARLARDGVELDFHVFAGVPHGFDGATTTNIAQAAMKLRHTAFNSF
ncbi:arylesterase monooxygenase [Niveomyces insectorum RCEF 264]|uniref:Arylesterase monooxygenase n=1 Tax=Niveomyces insectorum RCEF 264 TaxID=1081102 RepID=A0A167SR50_9HYPO|nr:arylesterase monooxygenase [Niveomyces insectorum RCEF 264]